jgi:hypothetical protein
MCSREGRVGHLPMLVEQREPAADLRPSACGLAAIFAW